jgi:hypothetical protein
MSDETPAIRRTGLAHKCAFVSLLRSDKPGSARLAAFDKAAVCLAAADETAWRRAWHAVELCQRVAELAARRAAGPVPESRA